MGLLRFSNRCRNLSVVFGLALILVLASVLFAPSAFFTATVLGATTEVVQKLLPAPGDFAFGGGIESFWIRLSFTNQPAQLVHHISSAPRGIFDPNATIHSEYWTFPGSPVPEGGRTPLGNGTYALIPDNVSPVYNPEIYAENPNEAEQESRYQTADPYYAHVFLIPNGIPPGTYVSRFEQYGVDPATGQPTLDAAAEEAFFVGTGITIFKYHDLNSNGLYDQDEPGMDGWQFTLSGAPGSLIDPKTNLAVSTVIDSTSGGGFLAVLATRPGNITVTETPKPGWMNTDPGGITLTKTVEIPLGLPEDGVVRFGDTDSYPEYNWPSSIAIPSSPAPTAGAVQPASMIISAPSIVAPGQEFTISVNVTQVVNLAAYQLQISYDPSVINVVGIEDGTSVTQGMIGQSPIRVLNWSFSPKGVQGTLKIVGNLWAGSSVSGSGYLAEIHFAAVGVPGQVTNIVFSSTGGFRNLLVDDQAAPITTSSLSGSSTRIVNQTQGNDPIRGDANGDGLVNMGDVTKVELIVLGLTDATPGADANGDGQVNMGDVTKIELVILGMP